MLERKTQFFGAYVHEKYGQHGMDIFFSIRGPKGAISCRIFTSWCLPQVQQSNFDLFSKYPYGPEYLMQPNIVDISYHAHEPQYEGECSRDGCSFLDGAPCYSDGSGLYGNECFRLGFLHGGSDWLFDRLEEEYEHRFNDGPPPNFTPVPRTFE